MNLVLFEDSHVDSLGPVVVGRPAYAITCGSYRLVDLLRSLSANIVGMVRPHLQTLQANDEPTFESKIDPSSELTLLVNARVVPSIRNRQQLVQMIEEAKTGGEALSTVIAGAKQGIAAAVVPTSLIVRDYGGAAAESIEKLIDACEGRSGGKESAVGLFEFPHDIVRCNMNCIADNLRHRVESGNYEQVADGVYIADGQQLPANVAVDASGGPIVIESNVTLGPFSYLRGPVYLGANVKVSEHASIKDEVSISHTCKVGGEIEATVFEPYSNKQHYGFLGHAYVGSWVNLGAGTCNSDLKNTYGKVNMVYGGQKTATGMQFMGCIIGDYAKTAINTSIFTGKQIGVGSMVYGWAAENVPSFVNYARSFGSCSLMSPEVMLTTQQRMFGRRSVPQRPCDQQLIRDMFRLTEGERPDDLPDQPPQF
jgi:glucose-1-phosphate thymidylyltransferase